MYIDANIFLFRAHNVILDSLRLVHLLVYIALMRDILYLLEYTGWASWIYLRCISWFIFSMDNSSRLWIIHITSINMGVTCDSNDRPILASFRLLIYNATKSEILSVVPFSLLAHPVGLCIVYVWIFHDNISVHLYLGELNTIGKVWQWLLVFLLYVRIVVYIKFHRLHSQIFSYWEWYLYFQTYLSLPFAAALWVQTFDDDFRRLTRNGNSMYVSENAWNQRNCTTRLRYTISPTILLTYIVMKKRRQPLSRLMSLHVGVFFAVWEKTAGAEPFSIASVRTRLN